MGNLNEYEQFSPVLRWETDTPALAGPNGPMNIPLQQLVNRTAWLKAQIDAINNALGGSNGNVFVIDALTSNSATNALAANQGLVLKGLYDNLVLALTGKLDASAYNDHYKGLHVTLANLNSSYPVAQSGNYALVDAGAGNDAIVYFWDVEGGWVTNGSSVSLTDTDALQEGSNHLYFNAGRAIAACETVFVRFDQQQTLTSQQLLQYHTNVQTYEAKPKNVNTGGLTNYDTDASDNAGNVVLRTMSTVANTVTVQSSLFRPITVRQADVGIVTLAQGANVQLNGNLVFSGIHDAKTIVPIGGGEYDVYGAPA